MDAGRRGFLVLAGGALSVLAGCADSDPSPSTTADPGATETTADEPGGGEGSTTTTTTGERSATSPTVTETTERSTATTTEPGDSPSIAVLNVISNEGEYEQGDVEREAIDEVDRGDRVALAARYRVTVHDGAVDVRFVMRIDDPEGFSAEYPPYEQSAEGLDAASIEDEFYKAFATDEFRPGEYTATLEVTDQLAARSTTATTTFTVTE